MTIREEMLQGARRSVGMLGAARQDVVDFVLSRHRPEGGFADRSGACDLYYTVFGVECLLALDAAAPVEALTDYLRRHEPGQMDLVQCASLARCWAAVSPTAAPQAVTDALAARIGEFRSADGGFAEEPQCPRGTSYAAFLSLGAMQDLGRQTADADALAASVESLLTPAGGYGHSGGPVGEPLTTTTAAAMVTLRHLGHTPAPKAIDWLLAQHLPAGGFRASSQLPWADLLSTATAIHALSGASPVSLARVMTPCLDFVESLWTDVGGFVGWCGDETPDVEYTLYALLTLGHLAAAAEG